MPFLKALLIAIEAPLYLGIHMVSRLSFGVRETRSDDPLATPPDWLRNDAL